MRMSLITLKFSTKEKVVTHTGIVNTQVLHAGDPADCVAELRWIEVKLIAKEKPEAVG